MKKLLFLILSIGLVSALAAEDAKAAAPQAQPDVGYALGMLLGANVKGSGLAFNSDSFIAGFKDSLDGKPPKYSELHWPRMSTSMVELMEIMWSFWAMTCGALV